MEFVCENCSNEFYSKKVLKNHLKKCSDIPNEYFDKKNYKRRIKNLDISEDEIKYDKIWDCGSKEYEYVKQ